MLKYRKESNTMKKLKLVAAALLLSVSSTQCMNFTAITESAGQMVGTAGNIAYNGAAAVVGESALQTAGTGLSWAGWGLGIVGDGMTLNNQWKMCQGINYTTKLIADGHAPAIVQKIKNKIMIAKIARDMGLSMRLSDDFILFCAIDNYDIDKVKRLIDLGVDIESHKEHCPVDLVKNNDSLALATFIVERKQKFASRGFAGLTLFYLSKKN